jgi:uncharacterized protein YbaR (Trm112 family)
MKIIIQLLYCNKCKKYIKPELCEETWICPDCKESLAFITEKGK